MYEVSKKVSGLAKLQVFWRGPGWSPDGKPIPIPHITRKSQIRYNQETWSKAFIIYAVLQFLSTVVILRRFGTNRDELTLLQNLLFVAFIATSLGSVGMVLDRNRKLAMLEPFRCVAAIVLLLWTKSHYPISSTIISVVGTFYGASLLWFLTQMSVITSTSKKLA